MDRLVSYSLPIKGLNTGTHEFIFHVDGEFFAHFEHSPVKTADIELVLVLDKRPGIMTMEFDFSGTIDTECDRCLAPIHLPVADSQVVMVKYSEEEGQEDADVIFIHPETPALDVSEYVYEFIILSIPMIKTYDCQEENPPVCDQEMLLLLEQGIEPPQVEEKEENPVWEKLKDLYRKE